MKRLALSAAGLLAVGLVVLWAVAQLQQTSARELPAMMPEGALVYIEAKDFDTLLNDWNGSEQKRVWLAGDNYQAFSRSRLFERLSRAQQEFSTAAGLATDYGFLNTVAGKQSCLAIYDIGNLAFVYLTRMDEHTAESTPLWQLRSSFEQRSEGGTQFYVRQDSQSGRTAAFAASNGWLILATREDLIAGVLDRLQSSGTRSLVGEGWFADAVKQANGPQGDLRMVLNLDKLVSSPYFRSYWVQQNVTEMKQYSAAVSDLYRTAANDREERVLVRKPGLAATATSDVSALAALAPDDASFFSAQASPKAEAVLGILRENLLEVKPANVQAQWNTAPPPPSNEDTGSAAMLDVRIDQAPVVIAQADAYAPLRELLGTMQPAAMLTVYTTQAPGNGVFQRIADGVVVEADEIWNDAAVRDVLVTAIQPGLTAGRVGVDWVRRSGSPGSYFALDGRVPLYVAVRDKQLFLANDSDLLEKMLARRQDSTQSTQAGVTYTAAYRHSPREQQNFRALFTMLDKTASAGGDDQGMQPQGESPAFFSGNMASLSRMFSNVSLETVQEKDEGAKVTQTVTYEWSH